jgi:hypothetical protein
VILVACHEYDLARAAKEGFCAAYVSRPAEWDRPHAVPAADIVAADLGDLAQQHTT